MCRNAKDEIEAVVREVTGGKKGAYAVAYTAGHEEAITFGLAVWWDELPPETSQIVKLSGVRKFFGGWRAASARPIVWPHT